jgi:hypothetical protein
MRNPFRRQAKEVPMGEKRQSLESRPQALVEVMEVVLPRQEDQEEPLEMEIDSGLLEEFATGEKVLHLLQLGEQERAFELAWSMGRHYTSTRSEVAREAVRHGYRRFVDILLDEEDQSMDFWESADGRLMQLFLRRGYPGEPARSDLALSSLHHLEKFVSDAGLLDADVRGAIGQRRRRARKISGAS